MKDSYLKVSKSPSLCGEVSLLGAKNAVLVIIASLLLTRGISVLKNVPTIDDVYAMSDLLQSLGAVIHFDKQNYELHVDTTLVTSNTISAELMKKTRTSILTMGPLLALYGSVIIEGLPGGDDIGARPIDYHLKNFKKLGVHVSQSGSILNASVLSLQAQRIVLAYPSVGATENILMLATRVPGITYIVNAAIEPEVIELIAVLNKMGARISVTAGATIIIEGVLILSPVVHEIMHDRLVAGSLLIAVAATGGSVSIPQARAYDMDVFLSSLEAMGHSVTSGANGQGVTLKASESPKSVSFKTSPYPGFPTDLQSPMMALQTKASGVSVIEETVFENRFLHVPYLQQMGASIETNCHKAFVQEVPHLYGTDVVACDIRASMALVVAGLMAEGQTTITGLSHWKRGYDGLEQTLSSMGARITVCEKNPSYVSTQSKKAPQKRA